MSVPALLTLFDQVADTVGSVKMLRAVCLEFAVCGRLAEQKGKADVRDCIFGNVIELISGQHIQTADYNQDGNGTPYVTGPSDFGEIEPNATRWSTSPKVIAQPGDILLTVKGSGVGKSNRLISQPVAIGRQIMAIRATDADADFLHLVVRSAANHFQKVKIGAAIPGISRKDVLELPIKLPSLAEQKRIVAKVEELMGLCDELEAAQAERERQRERLNAASLHRITTAPDDEALSKAARFHFQILPRVTVRPEQIPPLRQTILDLAVRGKVVEQDGGDDPVAALIEKIKADQAVLIAEKKIKKPGSIDDCSELPMLPKEWQWRRLDELIALGPTNGYSPKAVDYETSVKSLTLSATTGGVFDGRHSKFIDADIPEDSDLWLNNGDILVQRGNTIEYVGVPAIFKGDSHTFIYPDLMMKLRVSDLLDQDFVHEWMSSTFARNYLRARASGTSGSMPKINQATVRSLPIGVPPVAEQHRIVAKVDELMALCDELESSLNRTQTESRRLLDAVMAEITTSA